MSEPAKTAESNQKPQWAPRIWEGCDFLAWLRLVHRNGYAVSWRYVYIAVIVTFVSFVHMLLRFVEDAIFGRAVRKTEITEPPIFILGHWRTGTTFLHDLLACDARFGFPTTYQCLDPNHFLLTEGLFSRIFGFLIPKQRPMDNVKVGFDRPQEDEFALCLLGVPSPYATIAFPNRPPQWQEYLDLQGLSESELRGWKRMFKLFLKRVTYRVKKRLVLKSPPHTARVPVLNEMFSQAIFVHIMRDPYVVYLSTMKLWKTLYSLHGLQKPDFAGLEEHVLSTYVRMYQRLEEAKGQLDPSRIFEIRYEDLVKDPVSELKKFYEHFQLGGWDAFHTRLQAYLASIQGYEANKHPQLSDDQKAKISTRWGDVIRRYGYTVL